MALGTGSPAWDIPHIGSAPPRPGYGNAESASSAYGSVPQPSNPARDAIDFYSTAYQPERDLIASQNARGMGAYDARNSLLGARGANLQSDANFARQGADLRLAATGIDQRAAGADLANLGAERGLAGESLANTLAGFTNRGAGLDLKAKNAREDANSAATAAGAFFMPGRTRDLSRIDADLANAQQDLALGRTGADIANRGKLLDLDARQAQVQNRQDKLALAAREAGIDKSKAEEALKFGLAQLGYDKYLNHDQLMDLLDSTKGRDAELSRKIIGDALGMYQSIQGGSMGDAYQSYGHVPGPGATPSPNGPSATDELQARATPGRDAAKSILDRLLANARGAGGPVYK